MRGASEYAPAQMDTGKPASLRTPRREKEVYVQRHLSLPIYAAVFAMLAVSSSAATAVAEPATAPVPMQTAGATAPAATPTIAKLHEGLLAVMMDADEIGYSGRLDRLDIIVSNSFDLNFMAEKSVGRHWKKLSSEEQQRWLDSFRQMTAATYAGRFEGFSGQKFEVLGQESANHETVVVRAILLNPDGEDVNLNYRLHQIDGTWKVIDVYLNGTVSELALRRSEYSTVLKRDGFAKLIETIDDKTQELAANEIN